jgi:hypothetical protein
MIRLQGVIAEEGTFQIVFVYLNEQPAAQSAADGLFERVRREGQDAEMLAHIDRLFDRF